MDPLEWSEDEIITKHRSWPQGTGLDRVLARPHVRMLGVQEAMPRHLEDPLPVVLPERPHVEPPTRKMDRARINEEMRKLEQSEIEIALDDIEIVDDLGDDDIEIVVEEESIDEPRSDVMPIPLARRRSSEPEGTAQPIPEPPESLPMHRLSDLEEASEQPRAPAAEPEPRPSDPVQFAEAIVLHTPQAPPRIRDNDQEPKVIIDAQAETRPTGSRAEPSPPSAELPATWSSAGLPAPDLDEEDVPLLPASLIASTTAPLAFDNADDDWMRRSTSLAPIARERTIAPRPSRRGNSWKRWLSLLAAAAFGVFLVFAYVRLEPSLPEWSLPELAWKSSTGRLRIDVADPDVALAGVFVDGQHRCDTTPCVIDEVASGERVIKVVLPDRVLTETHVVKAGVDNLVVMRPATTPTTTAEPKPRAKPVGRVVLSSKLSDVSVALDGETKGKLPITLAELSVGKHVLKLSAPHRKPVEKTVDVQAGETVRLDDVALELEEGELKILSATPGARVLLAPKRGIRKALRGPFPKTFEIAPGTYDVIAVRPGFRPKVIPVEIDDDAPKAEITIELVPGGFAPRGKHEDIYE